MAYNTLYYRSTSVQGQNVITDNKQILNMQRQSFKLTNQVFFFIIIIDIAKSLLSSINLIKL